MIFVCLFDWSRILNVVQKYFKTYLFWKDFVLWNSTLCLIHDNLLKISSHFSRTDGWPYSRIHPTRQIVNYKGGQISVLCTYMYNEECGKNNQRHIKLKATNLCNIQVLHACKHVWVEICIDYFQITMYKECDFYFYF